MKKEKPLVDKKVRLEKFPGKGGWTFARVPEVRKSSNNPFGWVKVKGRIDGYEFTKYHLMPMGNGHLFLGVKAEIRKKIGKQEGDWVHIILFADEDPLEIPEEMLLCLKDEPSALRFFNKLPESEQKAYISWIYSSKTEETKIERLAESINRLARGLKQSARGDRQ